MLEQMLNFEEENYNALYEAIENNNFSFEKYAHYHGIYDDKHELSSFFLKDPIFSKLDNEKAMSLLKLCISKGQNINGVNSYSVLSILNNANFLFNNFAEITKLGLSFEEENTKTLSSYYHLFDKLDSYLTLLMPLNEIGYNATCSVIDNLDFSEMEKLVYINNNKNRELSNYLFKIIEHEIFTQDQKEKILEKMLKKGLDPNRCYFYNDKFDCIYNHIGSIKSFELLKKHYCTINDSYFIINFLAKNLYKNNGKSILKDRFNEIKENLHLFKTKSIEKIIKKLNVDSQLLEKLYYKNNFFNQTNHYFLKYYRNENTSFLEYFIKINLEQYELNNQFQLELKYLQSLGFDFSTIRATFYNIDDPDTIKILINEDINIDYKSTFDHINNKIKHKYIPFKKYAKNYTMMDFIYDEGIYATIQQKNKKLSDYVAITTLFDDKHQTIKKYIDILDKNYNLGPHLDYLIGNIGSKELLDYLLKNYPNEFYKKINFLKENNNFSLSNSLKIRLFKKTNFKNQEEFNNLFKNMSKIKDTYNNCYEINFIEKLFQNKKDKQFVINYFKDNYEEFINNSSVDSAYEFLKLLKINGIEIPLEDQYLIKVDDYDFNDVKSIEKFEKRYEKIINNKYDKLSKKFLLARFYNSLIEKKHTIINEEIFKYDNIVAMNSTLYLYNHDSILTKLKLSELSKENINKKDNKGYNIFDYCFSNLSLFFHTKERFFISARHYFNINKNNITNNIIFNYVLISISSALSKQNFIFSKKQVDYFKKKINEINQALLKNSEEQLPLIDNSVISKMEKDLLVSKYIAKENKDVKILRKKTL